VQVNGCVDVAATHPDDVLERFAIAGVPPFTARETDFAVRAAVGT
jgi:hypothetical protein